MIKKKPMKNIAEKKCRLFKQVTLIIIPKFCIEIVTKNKLTPKKENAKLYDIYKNVYFFYLPQFHLLIIWKRFKIKLVGKVFKNTFFF